MIDPIWLSPLDIDTIAAVRERTGRLLVVDNAWTHVRRRRRDRGPVAERLQGMRDLRVQRMGFAPTTCPTTPVAGRPLLPQRPHHRRRRHATWSKATRRGWLPEERPDLQSLEFKGPF